MRWRMLHDGVMEMVLVMVFRFRRSESESERLPAKFDFRLSACPEKKNVHSCPAIGQFFFFCQKSESRWCAFHGLEKRQQSLTLQEVSRSTGERKTRRSQEAAVFLSAVSHFSTKFLEEYVPNVSEQTWAGIPNTKYYYWISTEKHSVKTGDKTNDAVLCSSGRYTRPQTQKLIRETLIIHFGPF